MSSQIEKMTRDLTGPVSAIDLAYVIRTTVGYFGPGRTGTTAQSSFPARRACYPDPRPAAAAAFRSEIHLHVAFVLLRRARGVQRNLRNCITRLHEAILDQVLLDFFTANIGQHFAANLNTG